MKSSVRICNYFFFFFTKIQINLFALAFLIPKSDLIFFPKEEPNCARMEIYTRVKKKKRGRQKATAAAYH